ncbi:MAG: YihY/virulence factor BrkB family protein [Calothrix sp. MO_192.B10]|nr:YihY/virulence factor BrkB family protein [Calothrix sp. MO_192.B10]
MVNNLIYSCRHLNLVTIAKIIRAVGKRRLPGLAAEMAYNNLLALFPAIFAILTAIGSLNISEEKVGFLTQQMSLIVPSEAWGLIRSFTDNVILPEGQGLFSVSFAIALWIASGALSTAMGAMDYIYQIPPERQRPFWKAKLISLGLTIGSISLVLMASFIVFISDFIFNLILKNLNLFQSELLYVWGLLRWPAVLTILCCAFGFVYRYGPSQWKRGNPLIPGAVFAALLWAIISSLFRIYVENIANFNLTYGTLSTGVVLLLWLNLTSLAILIGVQLNVTIGEVIRRQAMVGR